MLPYILITLLCVLLALAVVSTSDGARAPRIQIGTAAFYDSRCGDAWQAVRWYRGRYNTHRRVMGLELAPPVEQAMQCRRLRERATYWVRAAKVNRVAARRLTRTIRDWPDWFRAVHEVQKAFPDTEAWLLSCSAAESRWGAWVIYGGRPYYPGAEYARTFHGPMVGGPMQYMWGTFKGHYRHGLDYLRSRGFIFHLPHPSDVRAWRSMTAQAIAGGWARWSGNDDLHWSASFSNGCR